MRSADYIVKDKLKRRLKDLRVSVIDSCNFRCTYCMPAEIYDQFHFLKKAQLLSFAEIIRVIKAFTALGVSKIRLTGGEPLLRKNLEELVRQIAKIPEINDIALTTNGYFLAEKALLLHKAGLQRVTISIDSLNEETFKKMAGRPVDINRVLHGIEHAKKAGFDVIKINTVLRRGVNEQEILPLVRYFKGTGIVLRFIEFMDTGNSRGWDWTQVIPSSEVIEQIHSQYPLEPINNTGSEVAKRYRYLDGSGEIGVISSVSQPFCGNCTRARLSADGQFYTCLFAEKKLDIRQALRNGISDQKLKEWLGQRWQLRQDRYSEIRHSLSLKEIQRRKKVDMFRVGG
ncbi:GTP 3',8-cyclase MoaA [Legionella clemsonensis]|uniref:GTP 3',8-cyclase n=1 Tax=Legionella clemsonensis TaxID=1867846 RepID=A0A222P017_9GAMM|nr:GTP 3',8-cyclase MoaA [Legionella clemsonensis]ASQ45166.1 Cyclic pyranopterin monophosphate synthase [Legionella clemsonensis]